MYAIQFRYSSPVVQLAIDFINWRTLRAGGIQESLYYRGASRRSAPATGSVGSVGVTGVRSSCGSQLTPYHGYN